MTQPVDPNSNPTSSSDSLVFNLHGERMEGIDASKIPTYNFLDPGLLSPADLRQLGILHARFIQHLSARLSSLLRMECLLTVTKFTSTTFSSFCESMKNPTHVSLFQVDPLRGIGLIEIGIPLGLAMADRLLGGKGHIAEEERSLTEIELALVENVVHLIIAEWTELWQDQLIALRPKFIGNETSSRFLQTSAPDAVFVTLNAEVSIGDKNEQLQIGIPYSMIETIVKKIQASQRHTQDTRVKQPQWRTPYAGISVPIIAELKVGEITLREAIAIAKGDMIPVASSIVAQTRVRLSNTEEFFATAGLQNGHVAVQLGQRAPND